MFIIFNYIIRIELFKKLKTKRNTNIRILIWIDKHFSVLQEYFKGK